MSDTVYWEGNGGVAPTTLAKVMMQEAAQDMFEACIEAFNAMATAQADHFDMDSKSEAGHAFDEPLAKTRKAIAKALGRTEGQP